MATEKEIEAAAISLCKARYCTVKNYPTFREEYIEQARAALEAAEKVRCER